VFRIVNSKAVMSNVTSRRRRRRRKRRRRRNTR